MSILKRMADEMMREAIEKHHAWSKTDPFYNSKLNTVIEKSLRGGLKLRIIANDFEFSLLVMRFGVLPSETEMRVIRGVFEVPEHVTAKPKSNKQIESFYWLVWQIPEKFKVKQIELEMKTAAN